MLAIQVYTRYLQVSCSAGFFKGVNGGGCGWSFLTKKLEFFLIMLEFFPQNTGVLKISCQIFKKVAVLYRNFFQKVPNIAFFGALCANLPSFVS